MTAKRPPLFLLTGASGVVGSAVARAMPRERLILGTHRTVLGEGYETLSIDIQRPDLGLSEAAYKALAERLTGIIHSAAITEMGGAAPGLEATNVSGVVHVLALAERAGCAFHHISTAYCSRTYGPAATEGSAYVTSKRAGEALVRESGLDWTIIRPSIVAGRSDTGAIARFQGFHLFIAAMLKGRLPFIPISRSALCDFTPVDWIADAIVRCAEAPEFGRTYWLTAGSDALTVEQMIDCGQPFARALGRDLHALPIVEPEDARATLMPALAKRGSPRLRGQLETLLELGTVMATPKPFPSDFPKVSRSQLEAALSANIRYWGETRGRPFEKGVGA
ncbi:MAG: SDR family oxidoreductase [Pseudomonadota bacterium]